MVKKALLIGINYKNTESELKGCINDINHINDILLTNCNYISSDIKILTDDTVDKPNKKNIEDNIKWLISNNVEGDTLLFYFSGHGSSIKDTSKDESDRKDEILIPLDYDEEGAITDDWLFENMTNKVPEKVSLWCFSDSCNSGTVMDLKYNYNSKCKYKGKGTPREYKSEEWSDKFAFNVEKSKDVKGNVFLFSGCLDKETSEDAFIANENQGAFTYCLIEVMRSNFIKDNIFDAKNVKLRNILKEINGRLIINKFDQKCQLSMSIQQNIEGFLNI
jgi:hypothetical protein